VILNFAGKSQAAEELANLCQDVLKGKRRMEHYVTPNAKMAFMEKVQFVGKVALLDTEMMAPSASSHPEEEEGVDLWEAVVKEATLKDVISILLYGILNVVRGSELLDAVFAHLFALQVWKT
jgi:hypothetical protein